MQTCGCQTSSKCMQMTSMVTKIPARRMTNFFNRGRMLNHILTAHVVDGAVTTFGCVEWESQLFRGVNRMRARCYPFNLPKRRFHSFNPQVYCTLIHIGTYQYARLHTSTYYFLTETGCVSTPILRISRQWQILPITRMCSCASCDSIPVRTLYILVHTLSL